MSNNNVKEWSEFQKLGELQNLEDLVFVGKNKLGGMLWLTNPIPVVLENKELYGVGEL